MVNQVANTSYNNSSYSSFAQYRKDKNFFVTQKYEAPKEEKNHHKVAITVGSTALVIGFAVLALMRGPKGASKTLNKIKNVLEKKVAKTTSLKPDSKVNKFYLGALNKINSFIGKSESINNFTSIKDALFKKFMGQWNWTRKLHDKITKVFEKISRETVITSWQNTKHKMSITLKNLNKADSKILAEKGDKLITINGVTRKGSDWVKILKASKQEISDTVVNNTHKNKLITRYKKIKTATQGLDDVTIDVFKDWKNKNLYQTFAADRVILKDKAALYDEMNLLRHQISFTRHDKLRSARNIIKKVETLSGTNDLNTIQKISQLKADLKNGLPNDTLIKKIDDLGKDLSINAEKTGTNKELTEMLNKAKALLNNNEQGKLDDVLNIYKKLLSPEDYAKLEKQTDGFVKALDKSINIEAEQFFDKVRDLQIGSAPTDVLSMVASGGWIGYNLLQADSKDERISVTLKAGIPVLGALATSMFCTARLISGGLAMAVGLGSGYLLNIMGEQADRLRKKLQTPDTPQQSGTNAL